MSTVTNKEQTNLLFKLIYVALWFAIPAGILYGISVQAFNTIFPAWFYPYGALLQISLWIAVVAAAKKYAPDQIVQVCVGSVMMFMLPMPLYLMMGGSQGFAGALSAIPLYSPYFAWAIPILVMAGVFVEKKIKQNKNAVSFLQSQG